MEDRRNDSNRVGGGGGNDLERMSSSDHCLKYKMSDDCVRATGYFDAITPVPAFMPSISPGFGRLEPHDLAGNEIAKCLGIAALFYEYSAERSTHCIVCQLGGVYSEAVVHILSVQQKMQENKTSNVACLQMQKKIRKLLNDAYLLV